MVSKGVYRVTVSLSKLLDVARARAPLLSSIFRTQDDGILEHDLAQSKGMDHGSHAGLIELHSIA